MPKKTIQLSDHFTYSRLLRFVLPCIGVFADDSQVIDYHHRPQFTPNLQTRLDTALETFWQALHRRDVQVPDLLSLRGNVHA